MRSNSSLPLRQELIRNYDVPEVAQFLPIERYYALAKRLYDQAIKTVAAGNLVLSYKYLHNVFTLINDRITKHDGYTKHNPNRMWGIKTCKACLVLLEKVVERMDAAVDEQLRLQQEQQTEEFLIDTFDAEPEQPAPAPTSTGRLTAPADPYPNVAAMSTVIPTDDSLMDSVSTDDESDAESVYQAAEEVEAEPTESLYPRKPSNAPVPEPGLTNSPYSLPGRVYNRFAGVTVPDIEITQKVAELERFAIPAPYISSYALAVGRETYAFERLDFHVTFSNFLKDLPPELQMARSAVEVNRCFYLHLGVGTRMHPFLLQVAFRNITANMLAELSKEDVQYEVMSSVSEYAGLVDANVLGYLWPVEFKQIRICVISGRQDQPMFSYFVCGDLDEREAVTDVILRCEMSHFTLLKPVGEHPEGLGFMQMIVDAENAGLIVQRFETQCTCSIHTTIDRIVGRY
jgi:hypothetical protein